MTAKVIPKSYHAGLQELRDALKYGEISFGFPEYVELGPNSRVDKRGPVGHMLTDEEFQKFIVTSSPHVNMQVVLQRAFGMEMNEIIELISYWNLLDAHRTQGLPKERLDAQEARLAYDEFLESLLANRPDYPNPELDKGEESEHQI
jgi:hypothetical protein